MGNLTIIPSILTNNDCYKAGKKITPKGIVVHSTGCNNPKLSRYCVNEEHLGKSSPNHWNQSKPDKKQKCVHAFIGLDKNKEVQVAQTLPWNMRCWGCGKGSKGSYNNNYIQFEICEDNLTSREYFNEVYDKAVEFCVYLCKQFNISPDNVVCHSEAHRLGYASNHADVMHWFPKYGKSMDTMRADIKERLAGRKETTQTDNLKNEFKPFRVKIKADELNIRTLPSTDGRIVGVIKDHGVYTIVDTNPEGTWGLLKSKAGWISIRPQYVDRI